MSKPEQKIQISAANYLRLKYPELIWTISPAGLIISRTLGILAVRMGYKKGTPDLLLFEPRGIFHGLFIELKAGENDTSDDQKEVLAALSKRNYATAVCWTYADVIGTVDKYMSLFPSYREY